MSAYVPSLTIDASTEIVRTRLLPVPGDVLVNIGDTVAANSCVLKAMLPGDLEILRIAENLDLEPEDVLQGMKVKKGESVKREQLLCSTKYFFGLFSAEYNSNSSGEIEFINETNGNVGLRLEPSPVEVDAYISGTITGLKERTSVSITCQGALLQGIFGVGGEQKGSLHTLNCSRKEVVKLDSLKSINLTGKILVGGSSFSEEALKYCAENGAKGVITASIDAGKLKRYVGYDIGVSITGDEDVPFTLIVTEGFGELAMSERFYQLSQSLSGKSASINGATQIRAGATRPELIVENSTQSSAIKEAKLEVGAEIRVIRVPYFGRFGIVTELPKTPEKIPSGAVVRVLKAKLSSGEEVTVPRANVELI